jgi:acetyl-CoA acetyltransferase
MSEAVWVLGASMTKIDRYPDRDLVGLASEASLNALADGGVTIHDMGVLAAGTQFNMGGLGQQLQKQIGQTGIPVYNVINACATGATAVRTVYMSIKAGESDMGLAVGAEQMGKMGLLGSGGSARSEKNVYEPSGRYGNVLPSDGWLGSGTMPAPGQLSRLTSGKSPG